MSQTFFTVKDSLEPSMEFTLRQNGQAIPLAGATVKMVITNNRTKAVTNTGHQTCSIVDEDAGTIAYQVQAGDFPKPADDYIGEFQITHSSGRLQILYETVIISVRDRTD